MRVGTFVPLLQRVTARIEGPLAKNLDPDDHRGKL